LEISQEQNSSLPILVNKLPRRRGIQKGILSGFAASSGVLHSFIPIRCAIGIILFGLEITSFYCSAFKVQFTSYLKI